MHCIHQHLKIIMAEDGRDAAMMGYDYAAGEEYKPIRVTEIVVIRKGTEGGNPTVDFLLQAPDGQKYVFMVTGALLKSIPCAPVNPA